MNDSDKTEFSIIMRAFEVNCSVKKITKDQLRLYFNAFKMFPISEIKEAFQKVMYDWIYPGKMPPVGVFSKALKKNQPLLEDQAEIQAAEVLNLIRTVGAYGNPVYLNPITKKIMSRRFNFTDLCKTLNVENETWFIKNFKEAYCAESEGFGLLSGPKKFKELTSDMFESVPALDKTKRRTLLNKQKEIILEKDSAGE